MHAPQLKSNEEETNGKSLPLLRTGSRGAAVGGKVIMHTPSRPGIILLDNQSETDPPSASGVPVPWPARRRSRMHYGVSVQSLA